jgi:uncharacterized protein (TIGR03118 family)
VRFFGSWSDRLSFAVVGLTSLIAACGDKNVEFVNIVPLPPVVDGNVFVQTNLVSDTAGFGAPVIDPDLVNSWGLAFGSTGNLWVANAGSGTSTIYNASGVKQPLTVAIPTTGAATGGAPTGILANATTDFAISGGPALFIFAGEDGVISAWNASSGANAVLVADRSPAGAVYKGIAMGQRNGQNFLFATNFKGNAIDVFDANFQYVTSFTDSTMTAGFAPFGIQNVGGLIYVTYAKQLAPDNEDDQAGPGNGFVDVFNANGTLARRFASGGGLNSPWGIALAPAGFGSMGGKILIGNFGDGKIGAYDATTGAFVDFLRDANGVAISIDGLWGLTFGPASAATTLYFASGPNDEAHGLVGTLVAR